MRPKGYPAQRTTFTRLTDARKWAQATEAAIREGRHFKTTEAKKHTLADLVDRYAREVLPSKKDGADQGRQLDWWKGELGAYALADVTPALIAPTRDKLAHQTTHRGLTTSSATVVRYLAALSHALASP